MTAYLQTCMEWMRPARLSAAGIYGGKQFSTCSPTSQVIHPVHCNLLERSQEMKHDTSRSVSGMVNLLHQLFSVV